LPVLDIRKFKDALPTSLVRDLWRLLGLCAVVGLVAGLGAIAFYTLLDLGRWFFLEYLAGYHPTPPGGEAPLLAEPATELNKWILFSIPAVGGLISGFLVYSLAPEAEGHGTDAAIDAYHNKHGVVRARVPLIKSIASAITIGTGGSGGREGPIAQIGAGFGSMFARWLKLRPHERRVLMAAGMGAGVGAIFHAPLAGALFAAEVLYKELDLEYEVIIPAVISSIIAYAVFAMQFGWSPLFITPDFVFQNPAELLPYFVLALVVALGATIYIQVFYGMRDLFKLLKIPNHIKPAIGGLVVGSFAFFLPKAMGTGYGIVQDAFTGNPGVGLLLAVGLAKIVTTSFTIGSGGSGGVFGPAVVIGGALGGATGLLMAELFPTMGLHPGAFALVGMAGFFAAAANTPLSTIIMVSEMTGNYHLLVPSMWVCFIAFMLCKSHTIYEMQIATRFEAPAHTGNMLKAVLKRLKVSDVLATSSIQKLNLVHEDTDFHSLSELFSNSDSSSFPVVDDDDNLLAMICGRDLRLMTGQTNLESLIVAADLANKPVTVSQEDDLFHSVRLMTSHQIDEIIVVEKENPRKCVSILSRNDIITAYHEFIISDQYRIDQPATE
jgi:CIC family chloride channel protein